MRFFVYGFRRDQTKNLREPCSPVLLKTKIKKCRVVMRYDDILLRFVICYYVLHEPKCGRTNLRRRWHQHNNIARNVCFVRIV